MASARGRAEHPFTIKVLGAFLLLILILFQYSPTQGQEHNFHTGVAITPKNFPCHSTYDLTQAFRMGRELGRVAVFIFQWNAIDMRNVEYVVRRTRKMGMIPMIGLSPTSLDQKRAALDLPATVRRTAGKNISFGNPIIRNAYIDVIRDLARLRLPYLCLATEINFLVLDRVDEYLQFAELYKAAYRQIKKLSPGTKVFVSFQWELLRSLHAKEPFRIGEHRKVIDIFRPELDVVGFTTYPSPHHYDPSHLPVDYYSKMHRYVKHYEVAVIMEIGWPTDGSGNEQQQHAFIRRLPRLLHQVNPSIVAWALLHDVRLDVFDVNLNSVGLVTRYGRKKKAYRTFQMLQQYRAPQ